MRDSKMISATDLTHLLMDQVCQSTSIVVDATLGNGADSFYLAPLVQKIYAFDIQQEAVTTAKAQLTGWNNIVYIHDSHDQIDKYVLQPIDLAVFNLGWRPLGDKSITTLPATTLAALQKTFELLKPDGCIIVTFYPAHPTGKQELQVVLPWLNSLTKKAMISHYSFITAVNAPVVYFICRRYTSDIKPDNNQK